ncbi:MAG TPA: hypothetical protein VGA29_08610 [Ignavibacteriaceae bacterium]
MSADKKKYFLLSFLFLFISCSKSQTFESYNTVINTSHLDFLYEDIAVNGKVMGIIHIYSNYPEYTWIGDDDEGIACVDDAARAAVFYLKHYQLTNTTESLGKAKKLLEFLLHMQADNGFFYNFIWEDYTINKEFRTSVAEPDWWSWRALWALMEGFHFYKDYESDFSLEILKSVNNIINELKKNIPYNYKTKTVDGFIRPTWLPYETASDQAAILLLGLTSYYRQTDDEVVLNYCNKLIEGMMLMQEGDSSSFPYGAFLSWENLWHGWGNLQSYALLNFYEVTKNDSIKNAALKEINYFYNYLISQKYLVEFIIGTDGKKIIPAEVKIFSQIAYIFRPMIYACLKAYETTGDTSYADKAIEIAEWFFGNNPAGQQMYFPENGKCFDGINNENELNKNSGAESTIEALLALLEIENNPVAKQIFNKKMEILFENAVNK